MMIHSIIENLQREDLNPIEEAKAYQSLIDKGYTHAEIADKMGKSRPYITNLVRLLTLPGFYSNGSRNWKIISSTCSTPNPATC